MSSNTKKNPQVQDAIVISRAGGPEVLVPVHRPIPEPAPTEVLIRIHAAGVNRHDCGQRSRGPNNHESDIPGLEVSGHVEAVGNEVRGLKTGDAVCALIDGGGYAQYAIAEASLTMPVPAGLSLDEAAAVPEAAFTCWYNFFSVAALQPGESVLIHGGTSGVGTFAIQLLRGLGYRVYATCGSDDKVAFARQLGATEVFNYRKGEFPGGLIESGLSVDVVLDMSGGKYMEQNLAALAHGGRIVHLSAGGGATVPLSLRAVMQKEARVTGSLMRPLPIQRKAQVAEALRRVVWPMLASQIRPVLSETFPLKDASEAHRKLESGDNIGKILLRP